MTAGNNKQTQHFYEFGPFRIDPLKRLLLAGQAPIPLTPKAFDVLLVLVQHHGEVVEKDNLMQAVWPDTVVEENNLTRSISALRKALGENPDEHRYIVTIPGRGYSFVASVAEWTDGRDEKQSVWPSPTELEEEPQRAQPPLPAAGPLRKRLLAGAILFAAIGMGAYLLASRTKPTVPFQKISLTTLTDTGNSPKATISPDGKYVAYVVGDAGKQGLRLRLLVTASEVEIVPPADVYYMGLTFSRDSNYVYFVARGSDPSPATLQRVPALGGPSIRLNDNLDSPVTFSPDGSRFAFVRGYPDQGASVLMTARADGAGEQRLASVRLPEFLDYPAWSPDGRVIACTKVDASRVVNVVQVGPETGALKPIGAPLPGYVRQLAWFRDGRGLAMSMTEPGTGIFSIWYLSHSGGEVRRITSNLNSLIGASLATDSSALVTVQEKLVSSLWVAPARDLGHARQVLYGASRYSQAAWTPDGRILFEKQTGENRNIWVMEPDGSNQKQLTLEGNNYNLSSCPNLPSVVYVSQRGGDFGIWKMNLDGSNPKELVRNNGETFPQCSPDGQSVVYTSLRSAKWHTLWKVPLDSGAPVQLHDHPARRPAISPDGKWIACFYGHEQGGEQIDPARVAVFPIEGGPPQKVFNIPQKVYEPAGIRWTAAGTALTYVDNRREVSNIWSQPLFGGPSRQLTDFKGDRIFRFDWSHDGKQLIFSRGTRAYDVVLIRDLK